MTETIDVRREAHVAVLRFANPPNNYATVGLLRGIAEALDGVDADPEIRAVVLMSAGKAFCAGADLVSPNGFGAAGSDPLREFYDQAIRIFAARKPIVAACRAPRLVPALGGPSPPTFASLRQRPDSRPTSPSSDFTQGLG